MSERVGVLAIQGDFERHMGAFRSIGVAREDLAEVRTVEDLAKVRRLVIPGGESTTVGKFLERDGLGKAIQDRAAQGMPVWGTCMGMILMANEIEGSDQYRLGILDVTVRRNAFGAQVHSFEDDIQVDGLDGSMTGVFIRAPIVVTHGPDVSPLATCRGVLVAVRRGRLVGTSFHPELTADTRLHELFLGL